MEINSTKEKVLFDIDKLNTIKLSNENALICGVDEVGRGPFAGPVVVCAVIMPLDNYIEGVNDSKKLSHKKRELLYDELINKAISYSIGLVDSDEIDKINILNATKKAAFNAINSLKIKPDIILTDALDIPEINIPIVKIIKGDEKSYNIGSASIIAKVYRDNLMNEYAKEYPNYLFEKNKGYGTKEHIMAIKNNGITPIHRRSFLKKYI